LSLTHFDLHSFRAPLLFAQELAQKVDHLHLLLGGVLLCRCTHEVEADDRKAATVAPVATVAVTPPPLSVCMARAALFGEAWEARSHEGAVSGPAGDRPNSITARCGPGLIVCASALCRCRSLGYLSCFPTLCH